MSLIALESFDGVDAAGLVLKGWNNADGAWTLATTSPAARTGSNYFRANNSNGAIRKSFAAATTVIWGFAYYAFSDADTHPVSSLYNDVGGNPEMRFELRPDNGITCLRENTGVTVATSASNAISRGAWHFVEIKCTAGDGTGVIIIKVDGVEVINATGLDTHHDGAVSYTGVQLGGTGSTSNITGWDDLYICNDSGSVNNTFLGDLRVRCLSPSADGNSSQFTGSDGNSVNNYQLVDEVPQSTADYVTGGTDNLKDTYTFTDIPDTTGGVAGIVISSLAQKTDVGARTLALVTRHSGTDYDSSDKGLASGSAAYVEQAQDVNPGTSAAWTRAQVNAAEFGVKARP